MTSFLHDVVNITRTFEKHHCKTPLTIEARQWDGTVSSSINIATWMENNGSKRPEIVFDNVTGLYVLSIDTL